MSEYLFVYGTLMSIIDHPMSVKLGKEARRVGFASTRGKLYDVGKWPGLVESTRVHDLVHGEIYEITDPATFEWLDAYEGITASAAASAEYVRVMRPVRLKSGRMVDAWVYVYQWDVSGAQPVPSGRWRPRTSNMPVVPKQEVARIA